MRRLIYIVIGRLPVVSREQPQQMIGYLGRSGVMQARSRRLEEEAKREPGWIGRLSVFPRLR